MKKVLIVGKLLTNVPAPEEISVKNISTFGASNLGEVKKVFERTSNEMDVVIIGAGIELETRLEIVKYIFELSDTVTIHMKDKVSGPGNFLPFINTVLRGMSDYSNRETIV